MDSLPGPRAPTTLRPIETPSPTSPRPLRFVARAAQLGPVGYRDPLCAISPDGAWIAYSEGAHLRARLTAGGPVRELGPADRALGHLAWLPDSRRIASFGWDPDRGGAASWLLHDVASGSRAPLWPDRPHVAGLRQLVWSSDGSALGAGGRTAHGELVRLDAAGRILGSLPVPGAASFPALSADGKHAACLAQLDGRPHLFRCAGEPGASALPLAYGPLAFAPDGSRIYCASPNARGFLDLWSRTPDGRGERLTQFSRDTWLPSVARDGRVLFSLQDYRACVARAPAEGGAAVALASFPSETPSWHPDGRQIGVTFGDWRRAIDDFCYPDIAQDLGVLSLDAPLPAAAPAWTVSATPSEDQGMSWSPDGRHIALHSHAGGSDDVWLVPANLSRPPRRISRGGVEVGWPRWSPDGRWIAYSSELEPRPPAQPDAPPRPRLARGIFVIGVDPTSGELRAAQQRVPLADHRGAPYQVEWSPDSTRLFFESRDGADARSLQVVPRGGGAPICVHRFASEQLWSGLGASPDGRWLAYVAPGADGFFQIFRVPASGGRAEQLTRDPSHKTHPCYSPDGREIALTIWSYESSFWLLDP